MSEKLPIQAELEREPVGVLARYLVGELSEEESQEIEELVAENPMYADALEGLKSLPDPALARAAGNDLRFQTRNLLRQKKPVQRQFNFMQYATAAVAVLVVLFVASAGLFFTSLREDSASPQMSQSSEQREAAPFVPAPLPPPTEPFASAGEVEATEKPASRPAVTEDLIAEASPLSESEEVMFDEEAASFTDDFAPVEAPAQAKEDARTASRTQLPATTPASAPSSIAKDTQQRDSHSLSLNVPMQGKPTLSEEKRREYENALTKEQAEQRKKEESEARRQQEEAREKRTMAQAEFEKKQAAEPSIPSGAESDSLERLAEIQAYPVDRVDQDNVLLEQVAVTSGNARPAKVSKAPAPSSQPWMADTARTYFEKGEYKTALPYLEQVAADEKAPAYQEARWMLAQSYLALGQEKEAKKLLKAIAKDKSSPYSLEAKEKLEKN